MTDKTEDLEHLMLKSYSYPKQTDHDIQEKIYKKLEFNSYKIPDRADMKDYNEIKEYRDNVCGRSFALLEHQNMLSNFINPDTPYNGLLLFHGLGTGKCVTGDTLVNIGGNMTSIKNIWNTYKGPICNDKDVMTAYWSIPIVPLYVQSFDDNNKTMTCGHVNYMYRQFILEKIKVVTLDNGMQIKLTNNHKLLTQRGWTNKFDINDFVYIPKCYVQQETDCENLDYNIVIIIAYILAKLTQHNSHTIILDNDELNVFDECVSALQYIPDFTIMSSSKNKNVVDVSNIIVFLQTHGLFKHRHIPDIIMNSNSDIIKIFLYNYFNSIHKSIDGYSYTISGKYLAYQIIDLLRFFNISVKIRQMLTTTSQVSNMWNIIIGHYDIDKFNKLFAFDYKTYTFPYNENVENFCKITQISMINYSGFVYDLNIKDYHNFVANGILCHNTCAAIAIAEKFKEQVSKYGVKIYVIVPGPNLKQEWREQLTKCTGNTYVKRTDKNTYITAQEKAKIQKDAYIQISQYYRILSYRSFYRKVLGEKIIDKNEIEDKKKKYRKTEEGEFERELSVDRIHNLNNSLLIVDEAHNLTGNNYGDAVKMIMKNSTNLKLILLSATPMKNLADDIVPLINLLRPENSQIDRDKIFTADKNYEMDFKQGGQEYLREMLRGYVSHLRGADPLIFAKRVDIGIVPKSLKFTQIIPCKMSSLQLSAYSEAMKTINDALDRHSEAVANFVFPGLDSSRKSIVGYHGKEGLDIVRNQLRVNPAIINNKLGELLKTKNNNLIQLGRDGKTIVGDFLLLENLQMFSTKFYRALKNINKLVWGKHGAHTAFIYSNLVKVGIDLFKTIMIQNGYLEYSENLVTSENTRCYFCGFPQSQHGGTLAFKTKKGETLEVPHHTFKPATFIIVTGKSSEDEQDTLPEESINLIDKVFNSMNNYDGKNIKFILGSKVINEGINMKNISEVHILDVHFNFGRVDQAVGRAIRRCSHYGVMSENNQYPEVHVYKYTVVLDNDEPSSEELLYQKAERKHSLIKKVERIMKEEAIDCALNKSGNVFKEEITKYKNCGTSGNDPCPAICDYTNCDYKCSNKKLNDLYYDNTTSEYKKIDRDDIDISTFSKRLARNEIDYAKKKIKELFLFGYVYSLETILDLIKHIYSHEKKNTYDKYYVFVALDELVPRTENDFNNYNEPVLDKYNREGYLIYVNKYYIFQPFDQKPNTPMYYRTKYDKYITNAVSLYDYIKHTAEYNKDRINDTTKQSQNEYNFDDVMEYYSSRKENDIIGIIDKEPNKKKLKTFDELEDVFKIRERKKKNQNKKRGTGIQTLTGTVCYNSQKKETLQNILEKLKIMNKSTLRTSMCNSLRDKLLELEKYSRDKDGNKMTYMFIPANHPKYPFPYNLEDRVSFIIEKINAKIKSALKIVVNEKKENKLPYYEIVINDNEQTRDNEQFLKSLGATKIKSDWVIDVK